jgi:hypothetical protein
VREAQRTGVPEAAEATAPKDAPRTGPAVAAVLGLQQSAGNQAVTRVLARAGFWDRLEAFFTGDYTAEIGAERVVVKSEAEERDAARIIKDLPTKYGVEVSSVKSLKALKSRLKSAPPDEVKKLKTRPWLYRELRAIERALKHFAPVLGKWRAGSTRSGDPQELVSIGKLEERYGKSGAGYKWQPTVLGEYFRESELRNFAMYKHNESSTVDFPGNLDKQMEATAVHEIAHGVFRYALPEFVGKMLYWLDEDTRTNVWDAEAPPTKYGTTNAREDLSETVMLYFVDPNRLLKGNGAPNGSPGNACPIRYKMIEGLVKGWTPPPPKPPPKDVGDYPLPQQAPDTVVV